MANKLKQAEWVEFYYKGNALSKEVIVETKLCKCPSRTKVYKDLVNKLDNLKVYEIGWRLLSNEY